MRKYRALVLLVALVLGGIVSPLSHYTYMALGGMVTAGQVGEGGQSDRHDAHHATPLSHAVDGASYTEADSQKVYCTYADLFATFAAALYAADTSPFISAVSASEFANPHSVDVDVVRPFQSRAPPRLA